jgi:aminocarboxymuconate-semialdehyde decarboxylase
MYIDMHAHYVPPKVLSVLEHDPSPYGTKLIEAAGGGQCVHFIYGLTIRPFFPELLDLEERWHEMERQGVDRQILSVWTDLSGYGMSVEEGARWHRLLNDIMCEEARQHSPRLSTFASVPLQDAQRWQQSWGSSLGRVLVGRGGTGGTALHPSHAAHATAPHAELWP